jgi:tight adherence protein C
MPMSVYLAVVAVAGAIPVLWWAVAGSDPVALAVRTNLPGERGSPTDVREVQLAQSARDRVLAPVFRHLAGVARRVTPGSVADQLERRIALAGMTGRWPTERVLAVKLVVGLAGFMLGLAWVAGRPSAGGMLVGATMPVLGFMAPEGLLHGRAKARQDLIRRQLADTLDEITISVEAGLGFEAAMAEAGRSGSGPLAEELLRTLQDIQVGMPRGEALSGLLVRTDVTDLRHFVIAVRQAEQYGVPIARVLRVQAKEMRERRRQRAEERAMKMPVKILVPTVFFILPALFIVILGPAALRLVDSLGG